MTLSVTGRVDGAGHHNTDYKIYYFERIRAGRTPPICTYPRACVLFVIVMTVIRTTCGRDGGDTIDGLTRTVFADYRVIIVYLFF